MATLKVYLFDTSLAFVQDDFSTGPLNFENDPSIRDAYPNTSADVGSLWTGNSNQGMCVSKEGSNLTQIHSVSVVR